MTRPKGTGGTVGTVYLLHFATPYRHARHYVGWASDLEARLDNHRRGQGARLLAVITAAGITWTLARTWTSVTRARERAIKRGGHTPRYCPLCRGAA